MLYYIFTLVFANVGVFTGIFISRNLNDGWFVGMAIGVMVLLSLIVATLIHFRIESERLEREADWDFAKSLIEENYKTTIELLDDFLYDENFGDIRTAKHYLESQYEKVKKM